MKRLKLRGEYLPSRKMVKISVVEMTHMEDSFGGRNGDGSKNFGGLAFVSTNGARLRSDESHSQFENKCTDAYFSTGPDSFTMYLPRTQGYLDRYYSISTLDEWKRIKEAVLEYNHVFKDL